MKAAIYSYRRVSTLRQKDGVSLAIQTDEDTLKKLSEEYNLPISTINFSDEGLSAYNGDHLKNELGLFIGAVKNGEVADGSILTVYSLDRLSRQSIGFAKQTYYDLTNNGISIYSMLDNHLYRAHNAADDIIATIIFERSNNESKTKSDRTNGTALKRISDHKNGVRTADGYSYLISLGSNPWWIANREDKAVVPHPYYWDIAKEVYQMILAGNGIIKIVNYLNANYKAPRTPTKINDPQRRPEWKFSTIASFHKRRGLYGEKSVKVKGEQYKLNGYYPAIMTETQWYELQAIKKRRQTAEGNRKRVSLVSGMGIAKCLHCGAMIAAGLCSDTHTTRFYCAGKRNLQNGCKGFSFKGLWLESTLLKICQTAIFRPKQPDTSNLGVLTIKLEEVEAKRKKATALFFELDMTEEIAAGIRKLQDEAAQLRVQIDDEHAKVAQVQTIMDFDSVMAEWKAVSDTALDESNQEERKRVRELIRQSVSKIEVGRFDDGLHFKFTLVDSSIKYAIHNGKRGDKGKLEWRVSDPTNVKAAIAEGFFPY